MTFLRHVERWLCVVGIMLLAIYVAGAIHRSVASRFALWRIDHLRTQEPATPKVAFRVIGVDVSLWSEKRLEAYKDSLARKLDQPLAKLQIPKLGLEVPVFEGTDDLTLNRGVGRIVGTAKVGTDGNVGIAGHRDGFFRVLKDIAVGDSIVLATPDKDLAYVVRNFEIVAPADTRVLQSSAQPELTLVTCYPFYFVGDAPQRFIVHATLTNSSLAKRQK